MTLGCDTSTASSDRSTTGWDRATAAGAGVGARARVVGVGRGVGEGRGGGGGGAEKESLKFIMFRIELSAS